MNRKFVLIAIVLITLSIILGAFGAHALKEKLAAEKLISFETGVRYQMYIGLLLFMLAMNADKIGQQISRTYWFLVAGIMLFSSSIYLLAIQDVIGWKLGFLGPVTPVGGLLLIIGCILLFVSVIKNKHEG